MNMQVSTLTRLVKSFPSAMISSFAKQYAEEYIKTYVKTVTFNDIMAAFANGQTVQSALGMASPEIKTLLINISQRCPWILDDITFETVLSWAGESNPQLVMQVVEDADLLQWMAESWSDGIVEIKKLANLE